MREVDGVVEELADGNENEADEAGAGAGAPKENVGLEEAAALLFDAKLMFAKGFGFDDGSSLSVVDAVGLLDDANVVEANGFEGFDDGGMDGADGAAAVAPEPPPRFLLHTSLQIK